LIRLPIGHEGDYETSFRSNGVQWLLQGALPSPGPCYRVGLAPRSPYVIRVQVVARARPLGLFSCDGMAQKGLSLGYLIPSRSSTLRGVQCWVPKLVLRGHWLLPRELGEDIHERVEGALAILGHGVQPELSRSRGRRDSPAAPMVGSSPHHKADGDRGGWPQSPSSRTGRPDRRGSLG
jgi:hypothetical protein